MRTHRITKPQKRLNGSPDAKGYSASGPQVIASQVLISSGTGALIFPSRK